MIVWLLLGALAWAGGLEDGDAAFANGDHPAALIAWSDALKQARSAYKADDERALLLRLAAAHRELGNTVLSAEVLELAASQSKDPVARAEVDVALARLHLHQGDYTGAIVGFRTAFYAFQKAGDPQGAANAALNLGVAQLRVGDLASARTSFDGAATLFTTLDDGVGQADALANVALVDRRQGHLRQARTKLDQALALYRTATSSQGQVDTLTNLAAVEVQLARPDAALAHLNQALALARQRKDLGQQAVLQQQLGALAWGAGDEDVAAAHLQAAITAYTEVGRTSDADQILLDLNVVRPLSPQQLQQILRRAQANKDPRVQARTLVQIGQQALLTDAGTVDKWANQAAKIARRFELTNLLWQALYLRAAAASHDREPKAALRYLDEAVDILDRQRRLLPPDDASAFAANHRVVYEALADLHLKADRPMQALAATQRLALSDEPLNAPELSTLAQREAGLQQALGDEIGAHGDSHRATDLRAHLAELRVEFAATVDRMRTDVGDLDARVRVAPEDLEALQGELPAGVAVLQPILLADRLVLLVFTKESLRAVNVDVSAEQLEKVLTKLTRALRAGFRDKAVLDPLAAQLGTWLWAPIADTVADHPTIVVSTSGALRQLPFALLRHEGQYLVEHAAVATISHVGSLRGAPQPLRVEGRGMLLVGNPDGSLPGAEAEVNALAGAFAGSTVLMGPAATRDAVLKQLEGRTTLHLATHGRIDPIEPNRSYLVLAGSDGESRLGYQEIPGLAPFLADARIVVLSACESGRPVQAKGGDGVVSIQGLAAQFRRAGVETLVASLWKVDDAGTRALMEGFYRELSTGNNAAVAMAKAQRSLLTSEQHQTPWVWAAFVVAGDWR